MSVGQIANLDEHDDDKTKFLYINTAVLVMTADDAFDPYQMKRHYVAGQMAV